MEVKKSFFTTINHPFHIEHLETVACNLCGSPNFRTIGVELDFYIRECAECGLVYVSPQPCADELPKFYAGMYADRDAETVASRSLGYMETHLRGVLHARRPEGGRLLDIGCGYGGLLERVSDLPWEITATEVSETAAAHVRDRLPGAQVHLGLVEDVDFPEASQDAITMVAVLEHLKDPKAVLARVSRWLAPGGILIVQVPYITPFLKLKRRLPFIPIYFEAPRHLYDFSPHTLTQYFRQAGYEDVRTEIARPYSSAGKLGEWMIWAVKAPGLLLHKLTGGSYVYPFASAIVVHGIKSGTS